MDRNGYNPSILCNERHCVICGTLRELTRHEVFHGAYRKKSKRYGLWVTVCPECHYMIHNGDGTLDRRLKREAQEQAITVNKWTVSDFRAEFGKNYLEE